jgi:hypothetical protein
MTKRPPIPARDSGGRFELNNPHDGTPIKEMFTLGDALLMITEKCTYRMQVADQIDPERTNPALPHNVVQKIFDHGTRSEILCNTLILAKVMFREEMLAIDTEKAKQLAFEALGDLMAMDEAVQAFKEAEQGGHRGSAAHAATAAFLGAALSRQRSRALQNGDAEGRSLRWRAAEHRSSVLPNREGIELG